MNSIIRYLTQISMVFVSMFLIFSCSEDVALPKSSIIIDRSEILSSNLSGDFTIKITSNISWTISLEGSDITWIDASPKKSRDNKKVIVSVIENLGETREAKVKITSDVDQSVYKEVVVRQIGTEAFVSISDVRMLKSNITSTAPEYLITQDWRASGMVNTIFSASNYPASSFAIQDGKGANSGVTIKTSESIWIEAGKVVEISLNGAILSKNANGVLELRLSDDSEVIQTEYDVAQLTPVLIGYDQFMSGDYESMYVAVEPVQVVTEQMNGTMEGKTEIQDQNNDRYIIYAYTDATFAGEYVPKGSGTIAGIASIMEGDKVILPMDIDDFTLNHPRFGAATGIKLPYIFSFKAKGTTDAEGMEYNTMRMSDGSVWSTQLDGGQSKQIVEPNDGTGVTMTWWKSTPSTGSDNNGVRFRCSADNVLDNIISMQMWPKETTPYGYALFTIPIGEDISGSLMFSYSLAGSNYAPYQWAIEYSTDGISWSDSGQGTDLYIPLTKRNVPHFYSVPIHLSRILERGSTLYVKLIPISTLRVGDGTGTTHSSEGGELRMNSSIVIAQLDNRTTPMPLNAIYSDSFDRIYGGVDYLLGVKLCNMAVHTGGDISSWSTPELSGLSGCNVSKRPGYVQIGAVPYSSMDPRTGFVNSVGELITPPLSTLTTTTNLELSFKAMAYKTNSGLSDASDLGGDKKSIRIEILNGGTINGSSSITIDNLSYVEFGDYTLDINGTEAVTQIKFTSDAVGSEFTRWFLDDLVINKK